jgi:hypothetical protein
MMDAVIALPTLDALRDYVLKELCARDRLDPQLTPLFEATVRRRGKPCGLFFHAQGPRRLKTYALWTGDEHRILFYGSSGERFAEARLSEDPDVMKLAG